MPRGVGKGSNRIRQAPATSLPGVAKISLYRNFASKDDLVVAYLEDRSSVFLHDWDKAFDRYRDQPRAQLRAIMTYIAERTPAK